MPKYSGLINSIGRFVSDNTEAVLKVVNSTKDKPGAFPDRLKASLWSNFIPLIGSIALSTPAVALQLGRVNEFRNDLISSREQTTLELIKDPALLTILVNNKKLFCDIIKNVVSSGIDVDAAKSTEINAKVEEFFSSITDIVRSIQIIAGEAKTLDDVQNQILLALDNNSTREGISLSENLLHLSGAVTELMSVNPGIFSENFQSMILTPADELHAKKYQATAIAILREAKRKNRGKDLGVYFEEYKIYKSGGKPLLDSYVEHYAHKRSLSGIHISGCDASSFVFDKFDFQFSKFNQVNFARCRFINCDFKYAIIDDDVNFTGAEIDAYTLKTLMPSIRQAAARGKNIRLNFKVIGNVDGMDFSGLNINGLDLKAAQFDHIKLTESQRTVIIADARKLEIVRDTQPLDKDEVTTRRKIQQFITNILPDLRAEIAKGRAENILFQEAYSAVENSLYKNITRMNSADQEVLIKILLNHGEAKKEFISDIISNLQNNIEYQEIVRSRFFGVTVQPVIRDLRAFDIKVKEFVESICNQSKYQFKEKTAKVRSGIRTEVIHVMTGKEERKQALRDFFLLLFNNKETNNFIHYDGSQKPTKFGKLLRRAVELFLPNTLKALTYPETKLGKLLQSRTLSQGIKLISAVIRNRAKFIEGYKNIAPVMDDLNMLFTWKTAEQTEKARADVLKYLLESNLIGKATISYDRHGRVIRDKNGDVLPNELAVDFLCSTIDQLNSKEEVRKLLCYMYDILEILDRHKVSESFTQLVYEHDPHKRRQILLGISDKFSQDELVVLEAGLEEILPTLTSIMAASSKMSGEVTRTSKNLPYIFPHKGTMDRMEKLFKLLQRNQGGMIDIGREVYGGKKCDFMDGIFNGSKDDPITFHHIRAEKFNATSSTFKHVVFSDSELIGYLEQDRPNFVFYGANFDHGTMINTKFERMMLSYSYFDSVQMTEVEFHDVKMDHAEMSNAIAKKSHIYDTDLVNSKLNNFLFSEGIIERVNLENAAGLNSSFEKTIIKRSSFKNADLTEGSFWNSELTDIIFDNAVMAKVNFRSTKLTNCSLRNVDLTDAKLDGIMLEGKIDLSGTHLTIQQLSILKEAAKKSGAQIIISKNRTATKEKGKFVDRISRERGIRGSSIVY